MKNNIELMDTVKKKKIVVFTGAGIDSESNIPTFRDTNDGMYLNENIMDIMSVSGWKNKKAEVLNFHNILRSKVKECHPNLAHTLLKDLEEKYEVTIITQNVSDLQERAGSSTVLHLHGELLKSRSTLNEKIYDCLGDLNIGDKCPLGSQLRPHTVLFEEMPYNVQESYEALLEADILVIIGTSLGITYTIPLLMSADPQEVFYIDPKPSKILDGHFKKMSYIKKSATEGMSKLFKKLNKK